jgi:hypothetical protein
LIVDGIEGDRRFKLDEDAHGAQGILTRSKMW